METQKTITLIIGDVIVNGIGTHTEELHHSDCSDLKKTINNQFFQKSSGTVETFNTIEEAREWYDEDAEELGYYFDEEVKVLPCAHKK